MSYSGHVDKDETPAIRHMVAICGVSGNISITTLASDKERPLADTQATTNTTTIIARADQHDIDLHKASDRVNFGSIRELIPVPYLLGVQTDSFDWLIGNERWKKRVEEDEANGTDTVPHMSGLDEVFNEISPIENFAQTMSLTFSGAVLRGAPPHRAGMQGEAITPTGAAVRQRRIPRTATPARSSPRPKPAGRLSAADPARHLHHRRHRASDRLPSSCAPRAPTSTAAGPRHRQGDLRREDHPGAAAHGWSSRSTSVTCSACVSTASASSPRSSS